MNAQRTGKQRWAARALIGSMTGLLILALAMVRPIAATPSEAQAPNVLLAGAAFWHTQTADDLHNFDYPGDHNLALDASGHPHIAYGYDHLYHAWHDGNVWHIETVDGAPSVGSCTSLALDAAGHLHISYRDLINSDLKYAYYDGSA